MRTLLATTLATVLLAAPAAAAPLFVGFPPPGGVAVSTTGVAGNTGGALRTYSGLVNSSYDELYFGFTAIAAPLFSGTTGTASTTQNLTAGAIGSSEIIWSAASPWTITLASGATTTAQVRFRTSFFDLADNNITGSAVTGSSVGIAGQPYVLEVDGMSGFKVLLAFEAFNGSSWVGVNTLYNGLSTPATCTGCVKTSSTGAFWYTPEPVPEPTSLSLLAVTAMLAARRMRRTRCN